MKKEMIQRILLILFMIAVLVYTIFNYQSGKMTLSSLLIAFAFLGYLLVSNICQLIADLRK